MSQPANDPPGVPARRAALRLLDAVLRRGQPLETALAGATQGITRADDRGLAHALAAAVLRRLGDLDALIDSATAKPLPPDAKARMALRLALAQALVLGTPPHAAIATVLPLVDGGPRRLVHGVFGTLMRGEVTLPPEAGLPLPVEYRWQRHWGQEVTEAARLLVAQQPPLDLSLAAGEDGAAWAKTLSGISLAAGHVRIPVGDRVDALPGYDEGRWWVQDLAASLPARLLGKGGGHALDLCAAPGGKTLQLASAGWQVTAIDVSESRLARLVQNLARTGLSAEVIAADIAAWLPREAAQAILLDAPCTATGIFRRHPDVLHRIRPADIAALAAVQAKLAVRAAGWLAPGGRMIFCTCSLESEEGEAQIDTLLKARPELEIDPVGQDELPAGIAPHARGYVRTLPGMLMEQGGLDGFFIARLRHTG